ncbi:MAG: endolytic transglycosylase MltG [Bacteroidetes bacterium]|nr:endolytic transglycosylase MltG [Bacteroidota bacterium]
MQKKWLLFISLILIFGCIILYLFFSSNTGNFSNKKYLYIKTGSTYEQVLQTLQDSAIVQNIHSFKRIASWLRLANNIHPGRYEIKKGMGNYTIINNLKKEDKVQ